MDSKRCGSESRDSQGGLLEGSELKWVLTGGPMQLKQIGCRNAAQCSMVLPGCKLRL